METKKNETKIKEFDAQQKEKLEELFKRLFNKSTKIHSVAKMVQLAYIGKDYTDILLEDFEIEESMNAIMEFNEFIHTETANYCYDVNDLLKGAS